MRVCVRVCVNSCVPPLVNSPVGYTVAIARVKKSTGLSVFGLLYYNTIITLPFLTAMVITSSEFLAVQSYPCVAAAPCGGAHVHVYTRAHSVDTLTNRHTRSRMQRSAVGRRSERSCSQRQLPPPPCAPIAVLACV